MSGDAAHAPDPEFPNPDPAVVAGSRNAPEHMVAEIPGGGLSLLPRLRRPTTVKGGHAWLIDPTAHTLEVLRRHDLGWLLIAGYEGASVVRAEPFDAIALDLAGPRVD